MNETTHDYEGLDLWDVGDKLRSFNKAHKALEAKLEDAKEKAKSISRGKVDGMPRAQNRSSRIENDAVNIADIEAAILDLDAKMIRLEKIIYKYLMQVPNSDMRCMIDYRYIFNMSWEQVAEEMEGCRDKGKRYNHPDPECYKKAFNRYKDKQRKAHKKC